MYACTVSIGVRACVAWDTLQRRNRLRNCERASIEYQLSHFAWTSCIAQSRRQNGEWRTLFIMAASYVFWVSSFISSVRECFVCLDINMFFKFVGPFCVCVSVETRDSREKRYKQCRLLTLPCVSVSCTNWNPSRIAFCRDEFVTMCRQDSEAPLIRCSVFWRVRPWTLTWNTMSRAKEEIYAKYSFNLSHFVSPHYATLNSWVNFNLVELSRWTQRRWQQINSYERRALRFIILFASNSFVIKLKQNKNSRLHKSCIYLFDDNRRVMHRIRYAFGDRAANSNARWISR